MNFRSAWGPMLHRFQSFVCVARASLVLSWPRKEEKGRRRGERKEKKGREEREEGKRKKKGGRKRREERKMKKKERKNEKKLLPGPGPQAAPQEPLHAVGSTQWPKRIVPEEAKGAALSRRRIRGRAAGGGVVILVFF